MTRLSVIVISLNSVAVLAQCLAALRDQAQAVGAELLVVRRGLQEDAACLALAGEHPHVTWIDAPAQSTIPQQRGLGIGCSQGEIVGLLEDDCVANPQWCAAAIASHEGPYKAVGGPIEAGAYQSALDWAVFICEYGRFLPPLAPPVRLLPGNNVTYRREALDGVDLEQGLYEVFLHEQWLAAGEVLQADAGLAVTNVNHWSAKKVLRSAYHHGRTFAAMRGGRLRWRRYLYGALSPLVPLVQTVRVMRTVMAKGRFGQALVRSLPWIVVFYEVWAWGEWHGYWFGPGTSAGEWQ